MINRIDGVYDEKCSSCNTLKPVNNYEIIDDQELWQDGELNSNDVKTLLYHQIIQQGVWKVIKEVK